MANRLEPVLRLFFVILLMFPGSLHLMSIPSFAWSIYTYGIVSAAVASILAPLLSSVELSLGFSLLIGSTMRCSYCFIAILFIVYAVAISFPLVADKKISCGCLGTFSPEISWWHVFALCTMSGVAVWISRSISTKQVAN
ncbi:MAG: hypothetical protein NTU79_04220 [Planctomycetota bacterium]|nr:hypothetical protein [Planctomycetota bacterium]